MAEPAPSSWDVWLARALLVAGLWFAGSGLFDLLRAIPARWDVLAPRLLGIGAGVLFLYAAWRLRAALRWDPPADE